MSTKIHNGYQLPRMSITAMRAFLDKLHKKISPLQIKLARERFASVCSEFLDHKALGLPLKEFKREISIGGPCAYGYAINTFLEKEEEFRKVPRRRDVGFDFEFEVCFIPIHHKLLAAIFTEQKVLVKAWESIKGVRDYHYQDSTDKPENVSDREWDRRGKDWNEALGQMTFGERGLVNEIKPPSPFFFTHDEIPNVLKHVPSLEKRVDHWAKEMFIQEKLDKKYPNPKDREWGEVFRIIDSFKTEEGQKSIESKRADIQSKLKPEITKETILEEYR